MEVRRLRHVKGIRIGRETLTHLLFVDDVYYYLSRIGREGARFQEILHLFKLATRMEISETKSALLTYGMEEDLGKEFSRYFPFQHYDLKE
jgi:hypothetical protein